ncbi:MAG: winged helix-turn-helix domain-containing protein [Commensalibacter sp.]
MMVNNGQPKNILVVEDDPSIALLLKYNLEKAGHKAEIANTCPIAMDQLKNNHWDAAILDWNLPGGSGLDVCRYIRNHTRTAHMAVIMLTARSEEIDEIMGFDVGVDDYVSKPFNMETFLLRLKAILRRSNFQEHIEIGQTILTYEDIHMNTQEHRVFRGDRPIILGPTEYRLLEFFVRHPRKVFSREELLLEIWGENLNVEIRTVDVHIRRLRKELNLQNDKNIIRTIRSAGYALDLE